MASVVIVGGQGFIGTHLAKGLRRVGHAVKVVDVRQPDGAGDMYSVSDVRDLSRLRDALRGAEVVYNLAAVHRDDVRPTSLYEQVNVTGAINICQVCKELHINRVIFCSTAAVYGAAVPDTSEDGETKPFNAYGRSKLLAEHVHRDWQADASSERCLVIVRPSVVFGEGNRGNVYELMRQIAAGRFVMVGTGTNRKSLAYVGNLSAFLIHVLRLGPGSHVFNYADKPDYSMQELVDVLTHALGRHRDRQVRIPFPLGYIGGLIFDLLSAATRRKFPISAIRVKKFCSTTTFSTRKAESTGFRAPIKLDAALKRTAQHDLVDTNPR